MNKMQVRKTEEPGSSWRLRQGLWEKDVRVAKWRVGKRSPAEARAWKSLKWWGARSAPEGWKGAMGRWPSWGREAGQRPSCRVSLAGLRTLFFSKYWKVIHACEMPWFMFLKISLVTVWGRNTEGLQWKTEWGSEWANTCSVPSICSVTRFTLIISFKNNGGSLLSTHWVLGALPGVLQILFLMLTTAVQGEVVLFLLTVTLQDAAAFKTSVSQMGKLGLVGEGQDLSAVCPTKANACFSPCRCLSAGDRETGAIGHKDAAVSFLDIVSVHN